MTSDNGLRLKAGFAFVILIGIVFLAIAYHVRNSISGWLLNSAGVSLLTAGILKAIEKFIMFPTLIRDQINDTLSTMFPYMESGIVGYVSNKELIIPILQERLTDASVCFAVSGIALKSIESLIQKEEFWKSIAGKSNTFKTIFILLSPRESNAYQCIRAEIKSRG